MLTQGVHLASSVGFYEWLNPPPVVNASYAGTKIKNYMEFRVTKKSAARIPSFLWIL